MVYGLKEWGGVAYDIALRPRASLGAAFVQGPAGIYPLGNEDSRPFYLIGGDCDEIHYEVGSDSFEVPDESDELRWGFVEHEYQSKGPSGEALGKRGLEIGGIESSGLISRPYSVDQSHVSMRSQAPSENLLLELRNLQAVHERRVREDLGDDGSACLSIARELDLDHDDAAVGFDGDEIRVAAS